MHPWFEPLGPLPDPRTLRGLIWFTVLGLALGFWAAQF